MSHCHTILLAVAACAGVFASSAAAAQTTPMALPEVVVSGTVSDPAGARVAGAAVVAMGAITGSARTDGQGAFTLRLPRGAIARRVTVRGTYAYLEAENRSGAIPLPLIYRPTHTVSGSADWTASARLPISGSARFTSDQFLSVPANGLSLVTRDGYTIVDLSAGDRVGTHLTVRGGVLNLGDTRLLRETSVDFNEEARRYFISVTSRF